MKCQSDVGVGWEYRSASEQERIPDVVQGFEEDERLQGVAADEKEVVLRPDAVRQHLLEEMEKSSEREGCSG